MKDKINNNKIEVLKDFFVITHNATIKGAHYDSVIRHETSHALYYADEIYRVIINNAWEALGLSYKARLKEFLTYHNYTEEVMPDEYGAYSIEDNNLNFPRSTGKNQTYTNRIIDYYNYKILNERSVV